MPTHTRGMSAHVARKNAAVENGTRPRSSNEDLKKNLKVPTDSRRTQATANTTAARGQGGVARRASHLGADEAKERQPKFYETDASSIDDTSNSVNTMQQLANDSHHHTRHARVSEDEQEGEESSSGDDVDEEEQDEESGEDLQADPDQDKKQTRPVGQMGRIEGDSYPDTTSGNVSLADGTEDQQNFNPLQAQYQNLLTRGPGTRLPLNKNRTVPAWTQQPVQQHQELQQQQHHHHHQQVQNLQRQQPGFDGPPSTDPFKVIVDASEAFSFAKAKPNATQNFTRPQAQNGQIPQPSAPDIAVATNAAQHGSVREPNTAHPTQKHQNQAIDGQGLSTHHQQDKHPATKSKSRRKSGQGHPAEQPARGSVQQPPDVVDNRGRQRVPQDSPNTTQQISNAQHGNGDTPLEQQAQLDYSPSDLYKMAYNDLKEQSFDDDPNTGDFQFPDNPEVRTLQQKLDHMATLPQDSQAEFFRSLDIDSWEEAGDWFLESFGQLTKKLKETRREKRKAAQAMEDEIAERHVAVSKKQKLTLTALGEMKESGGKVLQGTPKKTRKSK